MRARYSGSLCNLARGIGRRDSEHGPGSRPGRRRDVGRCAKSLYRKCSKGPFEYDIQARGAWLPPIGRKHDLKFLRRSGVKTSLTLLNRDILSDDLPFAVRLLKQCQTLRKPQALPQTGGQEPPVGAGRSSTVGGIKSTRLIEGHTPDTGPHPGISYFRPHTFDRTFEIPASEL